MLIKIYSVIRIISANLKIGFKKKKKMYSYQHQGPTQLWRPQEDW